MRPIIRATAKGHRAPRCSSTAAARGFTLIEIMVAIALVGLSLALIAPNLAALLPSARLDGSGKAIQAKLSEIRSEARIQAKRMEMEFDLDKARWRVVPPPEERLTSDQIIYADADVKDADKDWIDLEDAVEFAGAGDAKTGMTDKGRYFLVFDEYGFTGDQVIALRLINDPTMLWSLSIQGLTGQVQVERSETGELKHPEYVEEGSFR